ncbi:IS481 family transposase, partial [Cellulosimicrobium funkei]|nr:IS481 family transposase [Cellulosimicrobium funkei]
MSHANAALTPRARLKIARLIVEDGWSVSTAAKQYMVSWPTAQRWAQRYRIHGQDGMADKSSRPRTSPNRTPQAVVKKIVALRWRKRMGPVQIAFRLGLAASTVHAVLVRCGINRLRYIDRVTGEPIRRYEHPHAGSMIHVDVTKFGNIPDGGGHRFLGRQAGGKNRAATPDKPRNAHHNPKMGTAFVHTVVDDHSRVAYAEIHGDEKSVTAIGVLQRAVAWFADRDVVVERVLSDNGSCYRSHAWRDACAALDITPKRTRPYRPQTNGKIERFHRTLNDGWAYAQFYGSEAARRAALPGWIHQYNHHRPHTAIGNQSPISRLTNVPGQY